MTRERVGLIGALLLIGLMASMLLCPAGGPGAAVVSWLRHAIGSAVFGSAPDNPDPWKPPGDPGEHVAVTGGGAAVWHPSITVQPGDSIPVNVQVDIGPGADTAVVTIGPDTIPIALDISIDGPILPFRVWGEAAFDGPHLLYGVGESWEPLRLWGATAGPGIALGWGADPAAPGIDWVAPVFRVSRPVYSTIHAGAEAGWRLRQGPDEIHLGISAGFGF